MVQTYQKWWMFLELVGTEHQEDILCNQLTNHNQENILCSWLMDHSHGDRQHSQYLYLDQLHIEYNLTGHHKGVSNWYS